MDPDTDDIVQKMVADLRTGELPLAVEELLYKAVNDFTRWQLDLVCTQDSIKRGFEAIDGHSFRAGQVDYALGQLRRAQHYLARAEAKLDMIARLSDKCNGKGVTT